MPDFDPMQILTALMSFGAFCAVSAVALVLMARDRSTARLKMIAERRRELASANAGLLRARRRGPHRWQRTAVDHVIARLKVLQEGSLNELRRSMAMAGWRNPSGPAYFAAATLALPIVFGIVALMYTAAPAVAAKATAIKVMIVVGAGCTGGMLPRLFLLNAISKRKAALTRSFPDALDLMVICVEAGVSTEVAFNRVTEEMAGAGPEIAEEFGLLAAELAFLPDRRQPLENLAERTGLPAIKSLSTTLLQSEKYGTPVALGLRVLSQESREARMALAEKKAASLPATLTVPMIVFFLPVLFAVIAGPASIRIMNLN
ncbi:MAG: type II secretion system F family protein [Rhodospirillaceae bacterium]